MSEDKDIKICEESIETSEQETQENIIETLEQENTVQMPQRPPDLSQIPIMGFTMSIMANGDVDVDIDWELGLDSEHGKDMGELMYALTSGILNGRIRNEVLKKVAEEYLRKPFALKMMKTWKKRMFREGTDPLVQPYEVLKEGPQVEEHDDPDEEFALGD